MRQRKHMRHPFRSDELIEIFEIAHVALSSTRDLIGERTDLSDAYLSYLFNTLDNYLNPKEPNERQNKKRARKTNRSGAH